MWVRRAAIRPVPAYAQVPARALSDVEERLADDDMDSRQRLDDAFARFEQSQPALAERIANALSGAQDETALALGYFLTLSVWLAFDAAFGAELKEVGETELNSVEEAFSLDEQLRLSDPAEALDTDDVISMEQPHVLSFVNDHIDAALDANGHEADVDDVHAVYRVVLIEVLALSYAVQAPSNWTMPATEFQA